MNKRAVVCIGVNRAGTMNLLQAAAKGARDFEIWARTQQCATKLLVDDVAKTVTVKDIFGAVRDFVDSESYDQLIIYFSGHGILSAPGTEYWLLSDAPDDPNEAVNLNRSAEEARNSGIPHIVFVSDACRSSVQGLPLSGVTGGVIFPNRKFLPMRSEVDIFYATRPGDPAYEVPEAEATRRYRGIFTECLLKAVKAPEPKLVDQSASLAVISSRKLKPHLESTVPVEAAAIDINLRQTPELHVETDLPKYFAVVDQPMVCRGQSIRSVKSPPPPRTIDTALNVLYARYMENVPPRVSKQLKLIQESGLASEMEGLAFTRGRGHFETRTGFSVFGDFPRQTFAQRWRADPAFTESNNPGAQHIQLNPIDANSEQTPSTVVIEFASGTGALLAILPGFIGTVIVNKRRVVSVSYIPSDQTRRYQECLQCAKKLEEMRAFAAVAARHGGGIIEKRKTSKLANRIRQGKSIDPTLGLYAVYAYAQVGAYDDVFSIFNYMKVESHEIPVPFDVVMLAGRFKRGKNQVENVPHAPFAPMLSQGWSLLMKGDPLFLPIHQEMRPHLVPSLWTTLDLQGIEIARRAVLDERAI